MATSSVPVLRLSGSPREQGRQHGEALRDSIAAVREQWRASLSSRFKVDPDSFIETFLAETHFIDAMRRWTPSLLEEVEGIAEGSGRPLAETTAFQFMDEEWWFGTERYLKAPKAPANHCSVIASRAHNGRPPILAQNMDLRAYLDGGQAVIITLADNGSRAIIMTICGMIGLCGANDSGLGVVVNTLWQLPSSADGLAVACVMRGILDCPDIHSATTWIRKPRHASGQHYLIGDPAEFASFEASATMVNQLPWEKSPTFLHTNHPLNGKQNEQLRRAEENSRARYDTLCTLMTDKTPSIAEVKSVLSSREGPHPISVLPDVADANSAMTFASIVMELKCPPEIELAGGPPSSHPFHRLAFSGAGTTF